MSASKLDTWEYIRGDFKVPGLKPPEKRKTKYGSLLVYDPNGNGQGVDIPELQSSEKLMEAIRLRLQREERCAKG